MSTNSLSNAGHVFEPALQGISLKRFRLRYCMYNNCYYLHWDNSVCPPLAKIYGLECGVYRSSGIQRYKNEDEGQVYLVCEEGTERASVEWVIDFSCCGLVIQQFEIKARCDVESGVNFNVRGDDSVYITPSLGDQHTRLNRLTGCSRVSITMNLEPSANESARFLSASQNDSLPLDIIVNLMCPRKDDEIYAGELLLGLKFTSEDTGSHSDADSVSSTSLNGLSDVAIDNEGKAGQLQVHIVEGAGIVDEDTHKPFNTFAKCELLPCTGRYNSKQTSPRHNAYPTWAKEFFFESLTKYDIVSGGLEVILYDHHKFTSDSNIGGLRMCLPKKKQAKQTLNYAASPDSSPCVSRGSSPGLGDHCTNGNDSDDILSPPSYQITEAELNNCFRPKNATTLPRQTNRHSLPNSVSLQTVCLSPTHLSPEVLRRAPSPDVRYSSSRTLSPNMTRRSPIGTAAKNLFRKSGSHLINALSPATSPRSSPIGRRKLFSRHNSVETDYNHWWMEDTPKAEVNHWKQILEKNGEWVYFWHLIRPKLKAAC